MLEWNSSAESQTKLTVERLQIQNLIKAKDDATERYGQLVAALPGLSCLFKSFLRVVGRLLRTITSLQLSP